MSKKRRGEIERIDATTFRLRYRQRDDNGKRVTKIDCRFEGSEADAEKMLTKLLADFDGGKRKQQNAMLMSELLNEWNKPHVRQARSRRGVGPSDLAYTQSVIDNYLIPVIGNITVQKLTAKDVRDGMETIRTTKGTRKKGKPLSPKTMLHVYNKLYAALEFAKSDDLIGVNPMDGKIMSPVQPQKVDKQMPTADDGVKLINSFIGTKWRTMTAIVLETGFRLGEVTGLRYCDTSATFNSISVNGVIAKNADGEYEYRGYPKSRSGVRTVRVSPEIAPAIAAYRAELDEIRAVLGMQPVQDTDLIFTRDDDFTLPLRGDSVSHKFSDRMSDLNIPGTLHTLRHAHASYLITEKKEDLKLIQKRMGHADVMTTIRIYGHLKREIY